MTLECGTTWSPACLFRDADRGVGKRSVWDRWFIASRKRAGFRGSSLRHPTRLGEKPDKTAKERKEGPERIRTAIL